MGSRFKLYTARTSGNRSAVAGVLGFASPGDREPQHGGADAAHLRRGAAADLHADAPGQLPALR